MKITVPISAVVTASLFSCALCEAGGEKTTNKYIQ